MIKIVRETPVTALLLLVTVMVFLAMQVIFGGQITTAEAIFTSGGMYGNAIKYLPNQSWRLFSSIFVQIGWEQFILNGLMIYFVGQMAERIFGSVRFLLLYLLSGIMGNVFTLLFALTAITAGASIAIFGVFTSIVVLGYFGRNPYLKQLGRHYRMLIIINLLFNLFGSTVGLVGHIGAVVGGMLCAIFLSNAFETNLFSSSARLQALIAYLGLVVLMVYLAILS